MYVCVDDVDELVAQLGAEAVTVLKDPGDMPWGERLAAVAGPDGNPVALASEPRRKGGWHQRARMLIPALTSFLGERRGS